MLTIDPSTLQAHEPNGVFVLEFDIEHGHVQAFGPGDVYYHPPHGGTGPTLESGTTGGCYTEPQTIAEVQLWNAEDHYLAIFSSDQAMRTGGRQLALHWGDQLPTGIHRVLTETAQP